VTILYLFADSNSKRKKPFVVRNALKNNLSFDCHTANHSMNIYLWSFWLAKTSFGETMSLQNKPAPDFTLIDSNKQPVTLSEQRGKKIVLAFYPAAFSGICDEEMCIFQSHLTRLNEANAQVFGISPDSPFTNTKFAQVHGITFPLLSDLHLSATRSFGVEFQNFAFIEGYTACNRAVFIVDENGTITYEWVGVHPGMQPDYAEVLAAL